LRDVFFTDATHGWAVGDGGTILFYDGRGWTESRPTNQQLNAVFMVSSMEGWAVGEGGTLLRYNRGRWTLWTQDYIPEESLADIHMISANEGWFVTRESKIYHYTDGHWSLDRNSPDNSFGLNALSLAPDGTSGWAVGMNGVQVRFRGYWEPVRNADRDLHDVHVIAEDLGWAVGHSSLRYLSRQDCGMLGPTCWKDYQGSFPSSLTFYGIHMLSQVDAWAVGAQGVIYHWDGDRWTSVVEPHPFRKDLYAVFMVSPTEGWAVGQDGAIAHYTVPPPPPTNTVTPGPSPTPTTSRTPTPTVTPTPTTSPTATGTSPATVTPTFTLTPTATSAPGGASQPRGVWSLARSGGGDLLGLHFLDSTHGWVVGREGTILRYSNGTWEAQDSPTENDLHAVHMLSPTAGWAVGDQGILLRYAQGRWSLYEDAPIPTDDYVGITMTTDGQGWIIGRGGKVLQYSDGRWKQDLTAPDGVTGLNSIFITEDGSRGWAVGDGGILLERIGESAWQELGRIVFQNHYDGDIVPDPANAETPWAGWIVGEHVASNISGMLRYPSRECGARFAPCWVTYTEPPHADLYGVDLISPDNGWAVGEAGTIIHWDGASWTTLASPPTTSTLRAVQMLSPTEGWAVGDGGTILHYAPADNGRTEGPWGRRSGGLRTR